MMLLHAALLFIATLLPSPTTARPQNVVSVFRRDEVDLHKYSAVLAAVEPLRQQLKDEVRRALNPVGVWFHKLRGTNLEDPSNGLRAVNAAADVAYLRYEGRINAVVRAQNINVPLFNDLSRRISREPALKRKVLLQAYYYRLAADLDTMIGPPLPPLPPTAHGRSLSGTVVAPGGYPEDSPHMAAGGGMASLVPGAPPAAAATAAHINPADSEFTRFCRAVRTIEAERLKMRDVLKGELGVRVRALTTCR